MTSQTKEDKPVVPAPRSRAPRCELCGGPNGIVHVPSKILGTTFLICPRCSLEILNCEILDADEAARRVWRKMLAKEK